MNSNTDLHHSDDQDFSEFLNEYYLQSNSQSIEPEASYEGLYNKNYVKVNNIFFWNLI